MDILEPNPTQALSDLNYTITVVMKDYLAAVEKANSKEEKVPLDLRDLKKVQDAIKTRRYKAEVAAIKEALKELQREYNICLCKLIQQGEDDKDSKKGNGSKTK